MHRCLTVSAPLLRAWIHCPRAPEQFVASPLCLVGYVRWDARSDRVPPLQTIIFSSFPGRTKSCRPTGNLEARSGGIPICGPFIKFASASLRRPHTVFTAVGWDV